MRVLVPLVTGNAAFLSVSGLLVTLDALQAAALVGAIVFGVGVGAIVARRMSQLE